MTDAAYIISSPTGEAARSPGYATAEIVELDKRLWGHGTSYQLVQDRFDVTAEYAASAYEITTDYIEGMSDILKELEVYNAPTIKVDSPEVPGIDYNARPTVGSVGIDPNWPNNSSERPNLDNYPALTFPEIPELSLAPPDINIPGRPTLSEVGGPGDAPTVREVEIPGKPTLVMPDVPELNDITLPSAPNITIPEFDSTVPEVILSDPTQLTWEESPYNSEVWGVLLNKTIDGIVNGGTGLDPVIEQEIWDRALRRQQIEDDKAYREIEIYFAARGFDMPTGAMAGRLQEARVEIDKRNLDINADIAIKQADLAQKNTHFMMEMGRQAEVILRGFHDSQANRALEAARAIAENSIAYLNAQIARYNAGIEKYKADALVYSERIKAALTQVEIFKGQVEAAKVTAEVQSILVELYGKQVGAVQTVIEIYKAEMEGAKISSEVERNRIAVFGEMVRAYVAQIDAEKLKFDAYNSAVEAEKTIAQVYSEQVRAYVAEVDGKKATTEALALQLNTVSQKNTAEIQRYSAELEAYKTEIGAEATKVTALLDGFKAEVSAYVAETGAESARYQALIAVTGVKVEEARFNLQKNVAEIDAATKGYVAIKQLELEGTKGVMDVSAQLSASAMNAVSATASFGYNSSEQMAANFNYGANLQEQHSFSHETAQYNQNS